MYQIIKEIFLHALVKTDHGPYGKGRDKVLIRDANDRHYLPITEILPC